MDVAATLPMSSAGPIAVAHNPTLMSPAAATWVTVTVVAERIVTVTGIVAAVALAVAPAAPPSPPRPRLVTTNSPSPRLIT